MTPTEKREIQFKLRIYVNSFSSQKKAAESLSDCSEGTVIAMLNENEFGWEKISDSMWRNVGSQVGNTVEFHKLVETLNWHTLTLYFDTCKDEGATFAIVGNAGCGKTYTARWYTALNRKKSVYYIGCGEYMNKKQFLSNLLVQMGKNCNGMIIGELMETLIREIRKQHKPLIILDEVDKLPDPVLKFFITLYNELNTVCGFVWLSTNAIEKRIKRGLERNTVGYQELYSRIGSKFVELTQPSKDEVAEICKANGIHDKLTVAAICNEVMDLKGDLRRVGRNLLKERVKKNRKSKSAA